MQLTFCNICGEHHRPDFCPEFGPLPLPKPQWTTKGPIFADRINGEPRDHAEENQANNRAVEETGASAVAQDQGGEGCFHQARPFTPDDMKQECMPITKQRFDRNKYQRELMRQRRASERVKMTDRSLNNS
jgi:hypothetical protein